MLFSSSPIRNSLIKHSTTNRVIMNAFSRVSPLHKLSFVVLFTRLLEHFDDLLSNSWYKWYWLNYTHLYSMACRWTLHHTLTEKICSLLNTPGWSSSCTWNFLAKQNSHWSICRQTVMLQYQIAYHGLQSGRRIIADSWSQYEHLK